MASDYESVFWSEQEKYHDFVKKYESGITYTHPERVKGECSHICGRCPWPATTVKYPEYNGPRVTHL